MEGSNLPPPVSPQPSIGESGKLRSALDLLNIAKILALIVGIFSFLGAAWSGVSIAYGDYSVIFWVGYYVISGIINLLLYSRIPEYENLVRSRRYSEAKDDMITWSVLGVVFGFLAGLILLIVIFMYLEELERGAPAYQPPQPPPY